MGTLCLIVQWIYFIVAINLYSMKATIILNIPGFPQLHKVGSAGRSARSGIFLLQFKFYFLILNIEISVFLNT